MRNSIRETRVTMLAVLAVLGAASAAKAISIDLVWSGSGTNVTAAGGGGSATLTLEVYATFTVPPGLSGLAVSVSWDDNALTVVNCTLANTAGPQYVAGGSFQPLLGAGATCPTAPSGPGYQGGLDQQTPIGSGLPYLPGPGSVHIADLQFHVTAMFFGNTVVQSLMNPLPDGWGDNNLAFSLNAVFGTARARLAPEPTTGMLVGTGLLGLLAARRKRRG